MCLLFRGGTNPPKKSECRNHHLHHHGWRVLELYVAMSRRLGLKSPNFCLTNEKFSQFFQVFFNAVFLACWEKRLIAPWFWVNLKSFRIIQWTSSTFLSIVIGNTWLRVRLNRTRWMPIQSHQRWRRCEIDEICVCVCFTLFRGLLKQGTCDTTVA